MTPAMSRCLRCGRFHRKGARFCKYCGALIHQSDRLSSQKPSARTESNKASLTILLVIVVVALAGLTIFGLLGADQVTAEASTAGPPPPSPFQRYLLSDYDVEVSLPREWKEIDEESKLADLREELLADADTASLDLIRVFSNSSNNGFCFIGADRETEIDPDISDLRMKGQMFVRDDSHPSRKVGINIDTVAGRFVAVSDTWREGDGYVGIVIVAIQGRVFYLGCASYVETTTNEMKKRVVESLRYIKEL